MGGSPYPALRCVANPRPLTIDASDPGLYNDIYLPLLHDTNRYLLLYGGRDSAKSYFAAQWCILKLMREKDARGVLMRRRFNSIRDSQFQMIRGIVDRHGLGRFFNFTTSPLEVTFRPTGAKILARGLDDPDKTKSIADPTFIWYEEANEITETDWQKSTLSLRTSGKAVLQEIFTFNPEMEETWINRVFFPPKASYERPGGEFHFVPSIRDDATILHTTYRDNRHCPPGRRKLIEGIADQHYRAIYAWGLWGGALKGLVYPVFEIIDSFPEDARKVGHGLDFGFTNDPSALIRCGVWDKSLVFDEMLYRPGLTNQDIGAEMKRLGIGPHMPVWADSSEPKSIEEIRRQGFSIRGVTKGRDSVRKGIDLMKSHPILITRRSVNLLQEVVRYKWEEDRSGKLTNVPVDLWNHALDAARYWAMMTVAPAGGGALILA